MSVFVAAGDSGAFGCQRFDLNDIRPIPLWPGDSPHVISVGGTLLNVRQDGTYLDEAGWEDVLSQGGTGGGVNPVDKAPAFQQGTIQVNGQPVAILAADPKRNPDGNRQGPDVAASADPDSGFFVVHAVKNGDSVGESIGGTSAATPFWAASMLLVQQFAQQNGIDKLGPIAPLLYQIAGDPKFMNYDGIDSADGAVPRRGARRQPLRRLPGRLGLRDRARLAGRRGARERRGRGAQAQPAVGVTPHAPGFPIEPGTP